MSGWLVPENQWERQEFFDKVDEKGWRGDGAKQNFLGNFKPRASGGLWFLPSRAVATAGLEGATALGSFASLLLQPCPFR
jgi:hypothetical protein